MERYLDELESLKRRNYITTKENREANEKIKEQKERMKKLKDENRRFNKKINEIKEKERNIDFLL